MSQIWHSRDDALAPTIEYSFDDSGISELSTADIHPWMRRVLQSSPSVIREVLRERWRGLQYEGTRKLRDLVLQFEPRAIAVREKDVYLLVERLSYDEREERSWDVFLIPPPHEPRNVDSQLELSGFGKGGVLQEFLAGFGGLSENVYLLSKKFVSPAKIVPTSRIGCEIPIGSYWCSSMLFFVSDVGDSVCMRQDEMMACLLFKENEIVELGMDLNHFLTRFAEYRKTQSRWETGSFLDFVGRKRGQNAFLGRA